MQGGQPQLIVEHAQTCIGEETCWAIDRTVDRLALKLQQRVAFVFDAGDWPSGRPSGRAHKEPVDRAAVLATLS